MGVSAGVSFDKVDGAAWLKLEIQPAASPTSEKERVAELKDRLWPDFTDHMLWSVTIRPTAGMARASNPGKFPARSGDRRAALRAGDFRGPEGLKRDDGGVNLFRPDANARRFRNSAERMAMAPVPEPVFIEAVEQLVRIDRAWIPAARAGSTAALHDRERGLPRREAFGGIHLRRHRLPVGSYFKGGPAPVSIWVSENYTRAAIGGTGAVKCGGNYAASLRAQARPSIMAAIRWCSSMRRAPLHRGTWRHEHILRVR